MCYAKGAVVKGIPYPNGLRCKPRGRFSYDKSLAKCIKAVESKNGQIAACKTIQDLPKSTSGRMVLKGLLETKVATDINQQKRETLMDRNAMLPDFVKNKFVDEGRIIVTRPHEQFNGSKALGLIEKYNSNKNPGDPDYIDVEKYKDHIVDVSNLTLSEQRKLVAAGILEKTGKKQFTIKDTAQFLRADDDTKPDQYIPQIHSHKARLGGRSVEHANVHPNFVGAELGRYKKDDVSYREALRAYDKAMNAHDAWEKKNPGCTPPVDKHGKNTYPSHLWDKYGVLMKEADQKAKKIIDHNKNENEKLSEALCKRFADSNSSVLTQTVAFTPHSNMERKQVGVDSAGRAKYRYTNVGKDRDGKPIYSSATTERFAQEIQKKRDQETLDILAEKNVPSGEISQILRRPESKFNRGRNPETNINAMFTTTALITKKLDEYEKAGTITKETKNSVIASIKAGEPAAKELIRSVVDPKFEVTISQEVKKKPSDDEVPVPDEVFINNVKALNFAQGKDAVRVVSSLKVDKAKAIVADYPDKIDNLVEDSKVSVRASTRIK